jgi:3-hydroxy acid dehydrogenase/malonic semialdehyde reductase
MAKKITFITGATSGFGKACARTFAKEGRSLILTGRRDDRLQYLKNELIAQYRIDIQTLCFDVRNYEDCQSAINGLKFDDIEIDVLINNAGLAVGKGSIEDGLVDDWNRMIDTNVKGLLHVSKLIIPKLKAGSQIINIGSIAGKEVYPGGNVYCATKHAVDALTKGMRIDLVNRGIKVSQIAPGAADTEFSIVRFKGDKETADNVYQGFTPLVAQDIADAAWFIASRPSHVVINDMIIMPTAQASSQVLVKNN